MFKHILFPTDTSETANSAFKAAVSLARHYDGKITILNVHEEFMNKKEMQFLRISREKYKEMMKENAEESRAAIRELIATECDESESMCEVLLREGSPREVIPKVAEEIGADMIVMHSKGRSNLREVFLGSVAEHVVHVTRVPVLVLK